MKQKELTKTFMMISIEKNYFGLNGLYTNISALLELTFLVGCPQTYDVARFGGASLYFSWLGLY